MAITTTAASTNISSVPVGMLGSSFFRISASRSVPPVLTPRMKSMPMPSPETTPPISEATSVSEVYRGRKRSPISMKSESSSVAISVKKSALGPSLRHAAIISGMFIISAHTLTRMGVTKASAVDRPDTPPGAMSFGTVNMDSAKPTSAVPTTV